MFSLFTVCIARSIKEPTSILESSFHTDFWVRILVKTFQGNAKLLKNAIDSKWLVLK